MADRNSRISHPGGGRFILLMIIIVVFLVIALFQARNHQAGIRVAPMAQPQPTR